MNPTLDTQTIQAIRAVFASEPKIQTVILFGSRAKGTAKQGSDIDLALIGNAPLTFRDICRLDNQLDELDLPYQIDLIDYHTITNSELKDHIDRVGIII